MFLKWFLSALEAIGFFYLRGFVDSKIQNFQAKRKNGSPMFALKVNMEPTAGYFDVIWARWSACVVRDAHLHQVQRLASYILSKWDIYTKVTEATGIPEWVIGCIHYREADFNFRTHLANGDPLFNSDGTPIPTTHVPRNFGPFNSWHEGAIAALKLDGLDQVKSWDIVTALYELEKFNGFGYRKRGRVSPYVWSFTNQYASGKYVNDGVYDPNTIDEQCGSAAIIKVLLKTGVKIPETPPAQIT